ncbi:O-antigen polymerase [Enterococcus casseliflavus]|uniref:O-antigen polymerase n=1 Tax=Enterococcus casseliflavus TaxID=37734 RepID=UPI0014328D25|nr:O-antigen polymerase [Enterococcus casseliflavus]NKD32806.1 oligosaccharide repeat unit polymerase [Enterococcus casseliflavus]
MSLLFLFLFIVVLLTSKFLWGRIFTPFTVFLGSFTLCFCLFYGSSFLYKDLSSHSIIIVLFSIFSFICGSLIYKVIPKKNIGKSSKVKKNFYNEINIEVFSNIVFVLSVIGFMGYMISIQRSIGILNAIQNPNLLNIAISQDLIQVNSLILILFKLSLPNSGLILIQNLIFRKKKKNIIFWIISVAINISVRRNVLFYLIIFNLFIYLYFIQSKKLRKIDLKKFIPIILSLGTLISFFQYMQKSLNKETMILKPEIFSIPVSSNIINALLYYIGNPQSFSQYLEENNGIVNNVFFLGASLRFPYKMLSIPLGLNFDDTFLEMNFVNIPYLFNTTFSQYYVYIEGGIIWVIILYFFIGFVSSRFFVKYTKSNNFITLMWLSFITLCLFFSVREYLPILLDFWVFVVYMLTLMFITNFKKEKKIK